MPFDRSQIRRGMQLTGGDYPAHVGRLGAPSRPSPPIVYGAAPAPRAPYTKSLAPSLGEIASRQQAVQADLDAVLASLKSRRR